MRITLFAIALTAALGACATTDGGAGGTGAITASTPSPFPQAPRGSAPPPPVSVASHQAPPEGATPGGIVFGAWRSTPPAAYATQFQAQMSARLAGRDRRAVRQDLEGNGFGCEDVQNLDCRIEVSEQGCAYDWYVVLDAARPEPVIGFEKVCQAPQP